VSEYTKGPWIMIENHTNISIATGQYADGGHQVAFVAGNPNLPNRRANARLISLTPELLEALKAVRSQVCGDAICSQIDAAIAKAEGR
jgi:hypothetical protein